MCNWCGLIGAFDKTTGKHLPASQIPGLISGPVVITPPNCKWLGQQCDFNCMCGHNGINHDDAVAGSNLGDGPCAERSPGGLRCPCLHGSPVALSSVFVLAPTAATKAQIEYECKCPPHLLMVHSEQKNCAWMQAKLAGKEVK